MVKSVIGLLSLLLVSWLGSACGIVYRPDVQQGNVVTQEMVDQLEIGMTRRQVRFILGTPLIADPFHRERWDYYYFYRTVKGDYQQRVIHLIFNGDRLVEIRGDVQIRPRDPAAAESGHAPTALQPLPIVDCAPAFCAIL